MTAKTKLEQTIQQIELQEGQLLNYLTLGDIEIIKQALASYAEQLENGGWRTDVYNMPIDKNVLLFLRDNKTDKSLAVIGQASDDGFYLDDRSKINYWRWSPTHWMPLPQPPKEDEYAHKA